MIQYLIVGAVALVVGGLVVYLFMRMHTAALLVAEKAALTKECEIKDEQINSLRLEAEHNRNCYIDQVKATGDIKSRCESVENELSLHVARVEEMKAQLKQREDEASELREALSLQKQLVAKTTRERDMAPIDRSGRRAVLARC